jgi:hypothetical protein
MKFSCDAEWEKEHPRWNVQDMDGGVIFLDTPIGNDVSSHIVRTDQPTFVDGRMSFDPCEWRFEARKGSRELARYT